MKKIFEAESNDFFMCEMALEWIRQTPYIQGVLDTLRIYWRIDPWDLHRHPVDATNLAEVFHSIGREIERRRDMKFCTCRTLNDQHKTDCPKYGL